MQHLDTKTNGPIVVFNTYLWWRTGFKMKILEGSFKDEKKIIVEMESEDAYRMALKIMVKWGEEEYGSIKDEGLLYYHVPYSLHDWGGEQGKNCYNQTTPIQDIDHWPSDCSKTLMKVIGEELDHREDFPVTVLNITQLSGYRKDAHTSIYKKQWSPLSKEQLANPERLAMENHMEEIQMEQVRLMRRSCELEEVEENESDYIRSG